MKKKTPLIMPILSSILTVLFAVTSVLNFILNATFPAVMYGATAICSLVGAIFDWRRYKKEKANAEDEPSEDA